MNASSNAEPVTAALLVIGDEILSGRTKDKNIGTIADFCTELGIELKEVRVISDETDDIVDELNALRARYTHVFTTGGIGPTHDDITADAVALAFGVELPVNDEARTIIEVRARQMGFTVSEATLRMARIPVGGTLIANPVSGAPGFKIANVHVMAGVPKIMQAMLEEIAKSIKGGRKLFSRELVCGVGESVVADGLKTIQAAVPDVRIGSYPQMISNQREAGVTPIYAYIVLRAADAAPLDAACSKVQALLDGLHAERGIDLSKEKRE
jgi:molybdenum cofactor synthesis domain-containing protein